MSQGCWQAERELSGGAGGGGLTDRPRTPNLQFILSLSLWLSAREHREGGVLPVTSPGLLGIQSALAKLRDPRDPRETLS